MKINNSNVLLAEPDKLAPYRIVINRTMPFDPATLIGDSGLRIWRGPRVGDGLEGDEDHDYRSFCVDFFDFTKLSRSGNFLTELKSGEKSINGERRRWRLLRSSVQADAKIGEELFMQDGQKILRMIYDEFKIGDVELAGTVIRNSEGKRCTLCLCRDQEKRDGSWFPRCTCLDDDRHANVFALNLLAHAPSAFEQKIRPWGARIPR